MSLFRDQVPHTLAIFVCVGQADDRAEDERAIQVRLDGWLPRTGMSCFDAATAATDLLLKLRLLDDLYGELAQSGAKQPPAGGWPEPDTERARVKNELNAYWKRLAMHR